MKEYDKDFAHGLDNESIEVKMATEFVNGQFADSHEMREFKRTMVNNLVNMMLAYKEVVVK